MGHTLLIVDDYDDTRALLTILFETSGYAVMTAQDGNQAVAMTMKHRPSVIVMDIFMPHIDGINATRQIKATTDLEAIPIIAYTAQPTEQLDDHLFAGICAKPCPPDVLVQMVNAALAGERGMTYYGLSPRHAGSSTPPG